ncbi:flavin-containing monooxygenase 5-like [Lissotriton helveticus]
MARRVAVIGAGTSGLSAIKCCLDEVLEPTCFERTEDIGGLWRFKEDPELGRASIYKSLTINSSKEMMCYSDFPVPDNYPNYMHNSKIMDYFRLYAKHFGLLKYIRFKTTVRSIKERPDFSATGQWDVVTETDGVQESAIFDAILVCSGHHTFPQMPLDSFPGIEKFKGQYFHSRDYKHPEPFEGKRIIIIGIGNSGGDLSVEISRTASQVFLSTRRGSWIMKRIVENGYPLDVAFATRFNSMLSGLLPPSISNSMTEAALNKSFNHSNYGLLPQHRFYSQHPTANDELPNRIMSGHVIVKTNVKMFTETAAIFEDGTVEEDIDVVIFATGYSFSFPFFEDSVLKVHNNKISLYKKVFPPHMKKPTVAVIGLIQPLGSITTAAELQARWAVRVFKGLNKLPSIDKMEADIARRKEAYEKRYVSSQRHTIQVDYVDYMDDVAKEFGVKPNLLCLFLKDPRLAVEVFFGPCTAYQYRLTGPGKWKGARKAILTQWDRIIKPTRTRIPDVCVNPSMIPLLFKVAGLVLMFAVIVTFLK